LLSGVETVTNEDAFTWARRLASEEGILGGINRSRVQVALFSSPLESNFRTTGENRQM
jgi:cysteine synthase